MSPRLKLNTQITKTKFRLVFETPEVKIEKK